ncbi:uncharacterized protein BJ171DRAFT_599627 [Polychytrium aggregatum]|uniref:uncharacterized protein n=1 Tax=Polychytrium aggregatum TaxID=110093 RepID=UPI0022FEF77F|nr:uncharacterized protein BJ171DRAFT_599627 [Polychytrium aggregatum]KAI9204096.1 hypothetical protein BJ171DRAFT_599627 [Polychytrium aggregatum]
MSAPTIYVGPSNAAISDALNDFVQGLSAQAIARSGRFTVALSGGSLPSILSQTLKHNKSIDFSKWHVFFADERCVPLDHADSNFLLAKQTLLDFVPIPASQVYSIDPELATHHIKAAQAYDQVLRQVFGTADEFPVFDLILLGMGPDGHTASLFPGHALLSDHQSWVASLADSPKPPPARITLTFPVINRAQTVAFVATGGSKADILHEIFDLNVPYPSGLVRPVSGNLVWFIDEAAAAKLAAPTASYKL